MFADETKVEKSKRRGKVGLPAKRALRRADLWSWARKGRAFVRTIGDAWAWTAWQWGHSPELFGLKNF